MKSKILSFVVVPTILLITGMFCFLTLRNKWSFEIASYLIFLFTFVYVHFFERIIPKNKEWRNEKSMLWTDIKHLVLSTAIFDALGKSIALGVVVCLHNHFFEDYSFWDSIPFFAAYILANIIGEFLPYVYHRISHKGDQNSYLSLFLWKIHSIHHLPTSLNWFKTNWIHPINMFTNTILKMWPILLLGFSEEIIFLVGITHVVIAYISHANISTNRSILDYIIVTPRIHHYHHSIKMEEAKNYGNILPFWDILFGTYYNRKGSVDKVGVMKDAIYPKNKAYLKQLIFPISAFKDCCNFK